MATRNGSASWKGDVRTGSGLLTVGEDAWTAPYSWSRGCQGRPMSFAARRGSNETTHRSWAIGD
jgi:hypothetical protein